MIIFKLKIHQDKEKKWKNQTQKIKILETLFYFFIKQPQQRLYIYNLCDPAHTLGLSPSRIVYPYPLPSSKSDKTPYSYIRIQTTPF